MKHDPEWQSILDEMEEVDKLVRLVLSRNDVIVKRIEEYNKGRVTKRPESITRHSDKSASNVILTAEETIRPFKVNDSRVFKKD